ncbi:MAG: hypothetical protein LBO82_06395 [Synergistaceae bacterium]|jgi:hypothetical protein|nr:hypothetical protein [Synergistaceae bacterium]
MHERWTGKLKKAWGAVWEFVWLFVFGTFLDKRTAAIRKEAWDMNDNVMLLLFGDYLGLPNPVSYYTLEILPYLAEDMLPWQRRIMNRQSVVAEKAAQYDFT